MCNLKTSKLILFLSVTLIFHVLSAKEHNNSVVALMLQEDLTGEISIHFPVNQSRLIRDFSGNANSLMLLDKILNDKNFYSDIDSIVINGYSSPEGSISQNSRLSYERARAVREYIVQNYPHISSGKIVANGKVVDMQAISDIINNDLSIPYRRWAKDVVDMQGLSNEERLARLQNIGSGAVIRHITQYYAASLRSATGIMFYRASDHIVRDTPFVEEEMRVDTLLINNPADTVFIIKYDTIFIEGYEHIRKPLFALKTNLLFNAATAVNVELEIPIGKRWSILGEYIFPWWSIEHRQYFLEVINANIETRLWLGNRDIRPQLTGWFLGIYGGGGYYDIERGDKVYQSDFFISTGLTGGYAHTLGKKGNFRMEYSLGAGYFNTVYREYNPEWHLIRQLNGKYAWIGPTRLKISLVWLLHSNSYRLKTSN